MLKTAPSRSRLGKLLKMFEWLSEPRPPGSAKGADARRQTTNELAGSSGGTLDTAPVLRVFLRSGCDELELAVGF